ncbi:hypothetical protein FQN49_008344, partial [Arthroderma sp. PD_2]
MQAIDGGRLMQPGSKVSTNGTESTGFSHNAYASNQHLGFTDRNARRANIPAINTNSTSPNSKEQLPYNTQFDMNFAPLLPSQLLLGSPFQPGTPSAFASPQFGNFPGFPQSNQNVGQNHQNQLNSPTQAQHGALSPQMYQSLMSPDGMGSSQLLGGPHSPISGLPGFANAFAPSPQLQSGHGVLSGTSRTVYLGNLPPETTSEEILGHVRSGQIES